MLFIENALWKVMGKYVYHEKSIVILYIKLLENQTIEYIIYNQANTDYYYLMTFRYIWI